MFYGTSFYHLRLDISVHDWFSVKMLSWPTVVSPEQSSEDDATPYSFSYSRSDSSSTWLEISDEFYLQ